MDVTITEMKRDVPAPDAVRTFALRLARQCLLRRLCAPDHPVLLTEGRLVDAARANLRRYLTSTYVRDEFDLTVERVKRDVVTIAEGKILLQVDDVSLREDVIRSIREENLDVLIPVIN